MCDKNLNGKSKVSGRIDPRNNQEESPNTETIKEWLQRWCNRITGTLDGVIKGTSPLAVATIFGALGCGIVYGIIQASAAYRQSASRSMNLVAPAFIIIVILAICIFLWSSSSNRENIKSMDARFSSLLIINVVIILFSASLINVSQQVIDSSHPGKSTLEEYIDCLKSPTGQACDKKNSNLSDFQSLLDIYSNYEILMRTLQAVAGIMIMLIIFVSVVALYKHWMSNKVWCTINRYERRQTVTKWYVEMSLYPASFVVLVLIALEILQTASSYNKFKYVTPIALGVISIIEGSIIFNSVKDIWNFIFIEDWKKSRNSASVQLVVKNLGHSKIRPVILGTLLVGAIWILSTI